MNNLKSLLLVAAASSALMACTSADADMGYLGSRDDIIINGSATQNVAKDAVKEDVKARIETVKMTDSELADAAMETVTMRTAVVTEKVSSTSSTPKANMVRTPAMPTGASGDIPPNARPGECYAKVLIPAVTETKTERFQVSEEQRVLDRIVPARYETKTERVMVKEARQFWKAGTGPITKKDVVTGEILCLVEEPAEYRTIEKRVMISPEKPEYKTLPAKYETITKKNIIKGESWEWRRILCETNLSRGAIMQIQRGLQSKGFGVNADGVLGSETMDAINSYQLKNGLASRGITYETLSHMGVSLAGA